MALAKLTELPNQLIPNVVQEFSEPWNHLVYYDDKFKVARLDFLGLIPSNFEH